MERYQLIIFVVVVATLFVLGFLFGRWLHSLAPSIADALRAAWAWLINLHFGRGGTSPGNAQPPAPFGRAPDGYAYRDSFDCHNGRDADGFTCLTVDAPGVA